MVPNPVDTYCFHPAVPSAAMREKLAIGEHDVVVTHASNLKALKRPLDIVLAAQAGLERAEQLLFVIAGEGACRDEMLAECSARRLVDRFRFPGWLAYDHMPELMCSSHMVVMPSEAECQALVYLEAQACARTLIASDIPAAREVIDHGLSGLLFPVGDVQALSETILACAGDPKLRRALGARARERAQAHALPLVTDEYERLLRALV